MKWLTRGGLAALVAVTTATAWPAAASARTAGPERFDGFLVASGVSGHRVVLTSQVTARGVFNGFGRIVEVPNRPGDPESLSRDNLVFRAGTMHIASLTTGAKFALNRRTCVFQVNLRQTTRVQGGTRTFAGAAGRFDATVVGHGVAARNADGSCSMSKLPLLDTDVVSGRGWLSY